MEHEATASRIAVLGLGNVLLGDDAVGPRLAESIASRFELPAGVQVLDLGTPGLDLTPYLLDLDAVLFVDAVALGEAPGTIRLLDRDSILGADLSPRVSPHDPGVQQALQIVELTQGRRIDAAVLGIQPAATGLGEPLSPSVQAALPSLERVVIEWLSGHGAAITPTANEDDS